MIFIDTYLRRKISIESHMKIINPNCYLGQQWNWLCNFSASQWKEQSLSQRSGLRQNWSRISGRIGHSWWGSRLGPAMTRVNTVSGDWWWHLGDIGAMVSPSSPGCRCPLCAGPPSVLCRSWCASSTRHRCPENICNVNKNIFQNYLTHTDGIEPIDLRKH